jgi:hypothetical protein
MKANKHEGHNDGNVRAWVGPGEGEARIGKGQDGKDKRKTKETKEKGLTGRENRDVIRIFGQ